MENETIKQKLQSRVFWGVVTYFLVSTSVLFWMLFYKCNTEPYNHEDARQYFDLWSEYGIWLIVSFGSMSGIRHIAQFIPTRKQRNNETL